mgnify:CR=1 FL=1
MGGFFEAWGRNSALLSYGRIAVLPYCPITLLRLGSGYLI